MYETVKLKCKSFDDFFRYPFLILTIRSVKEYCEYKVVFYLKIKLYSVVGIHLKTYKTGSKSMWYLFSHLLISS